jgi:aldehyde:ferredoxin oxidoreductase
MQVLCTDYYHATEAAGLCFMALVFETYRFIEFFRAVTGWEASLDDLATIGARIMNLRQLFNLGEGLDPTSLKMPDRLIGKPGYAEGPLAGIKIDIELLLDDYYRARDWDRATGFPSVPELNRLGLMPIVEKAGIDLGK